LHVNQAKHDNIEELDNMCIQGIRDQIHNTMANTLVQLIWWCVQGWLNGVYAGNAVQVVGTCYVQELQQVMVSLSTCIFLNAQVVGVVVEDFGSLYDFGCRCWKPRE
jgi:hypothetical protein